MARFPKWRLTQTSLYRLMFAIIFVLVSCYISRAQPPASPEPSDEDTATAEAEAEAVPISPVVTAALNAITSRDPQTPTELIDAVGILQRLGAYPEARGYLERVTEQQLDAEAMLKIHEDVGTATLVRLSNDTALMPEARDLVQQVFAAANQVNRDPQRLQQLIASLADDDEENRRIAMSELAVVGSHAVPVLLDAMRSPEHGQISKQLEAALVRIGEDGEDALIAALGSPEPFLQAVAARALRSGTNRSRVHLIRPYFVGQGVIRQLSRESLGQLGGQYPSTVDGSVDLLRRLAIRHLEGEPPFPPDLDGMLEMWTWNAERRNVVQNRLTKREAAALAAARLARDAYELSPTVENGRLLLVSRLQVDQLLGGLDELLPKGIGSAYEFGIKIGTSSASTALSYCLEHGYDAAAIGAAELIGDLCGDKVDSNDEWMPLTRALRSPNRRIRYAAARAIMKIDPRRAYAGSSVLLDALIDLSETSGSPRAIVATPRTDVRENLASLMRSLGFSVYRANEGRPCLKEAFRSSDYDVMLLSDSVSRPTADETIQQLRKDPRGRLLPVILLSRQDRLARTEHLASLDNLVVTMPEFADEATLVSRLETVEGMVSDFSVPATRRLEHAKGALNWLSHLAQYSQTYPWYDVMRSREVAIKTTSHLQLAAASVDLLGYLGDEAAQKLLADTASQRHWSVDHRQRAANAFAEAVNRHGLMLRQAEVNLQYNRYNASENDEVATQEILGQLLDVIETQTKPTSISLQK